MTSRPVRLGAILSILLFTLTQPALLDAATKKKKPAARRKATATRKAAPKPAAPPADVPVGATFEQRLASLVNGGVARSSDASIQIVEVDTGRVVAERNPHMPLAPASNMKLFTTAAAIDLLKPSFEVTTSVFVRGDV
ncbi:MAG TPA: D-alanyl-D-alanine carboxypeptidase, partial [Thermoanaerobaculia bacterium]